MQIVQWSIDNGFIDIQHGPEIALSIYDYLYLFSSFSGENRLFISKLDPEKNATSWTTVVIDKDIPIIGASFIYNQSRLYIFGGTIDGSPTNSVYYAPIKTNRMLGTIKRAKNLPFYISNANIVKWNDKVYLFGGKYQDGDATSHIHEIIFNENGILKSINKLEETLPVPLFNSTSLIYKNNIFLFGGNTGSFPSSNIVRIINDPITNKLIIKTLNTLPIPLEKPCIGQLGDKIYVVGGKTLNSDGKSKISRDTYISLFSPNGNLPRWTKDLPLPYEITNMSIVSNKSSFYIVGGLINNLNDRIIIHPRFYDVNEKDDTLDSVIKSKLVKQVRFLNVSISLLIIMIVSFIVFFSII